MSELISVTNRSTGLVYYEVPEIHVAREFHPQETKKISPEEIAAVCSQPGGRELFYHYLFIQSQEVLQETLNVKEEPEYWLTEKDIPEWLNISTVDEFSDALNFAPEGVRDLIKKYAVSVPLNDMNKREMIKKTLGFDVTAAIKALEPTEEEIAKENSAQIPAGRKTNPQYKIVQPKKD